MKKNKSLNLKSVKPTVWVRILTLILSLLNLVAIELFDFKLLPYTDEEIYSGVSVLITVAISVYTTWKNNSFTEEAQEADKLIEAKRKGKIQ